MLTRLGITNFALIDKLQVEFASGFNVLTGETGAGKSIIIDAVEVVLGGRAYEDYIRSGESEAFLEAEFSLLDAPERVKQLLAREQLLDAERPDSVLLTREINRSGRNYARVNGQLATAALLRELSSGLLDIHGQHEHQSLLRTETHLQLLDHFAGQEAAKLRERIGRAFADLRGVEKELFGLTGDERGREQRRDLLEFQLEELESAGLVEGEDEELLAERRKLANVEKLARWAQEAHAFLAEGDMAAPSVLESLGEVVGRLQQIASVDPDQAEVAEQVAGLQYQLEDASRELRTYAESAQYDPERLQQIQNRLDLLATLKRKYGDTITAVLRHKEQVQAELDRFDRAGELIKKLTAGREELRRQLAHDSLALSRVRKQRAPELEKAIEKQLAELGMAKNRVAVAITHQLDPEKGLDLPSGELVTTEGGQDRVAFTSRGIDEVEILFSPNPGEPVKPLARIASGGELARVMLALKTISADTFVVPTLIFDEIDAGVGGRVLRNVAEKLAALAADHQVVCVTHQPVLASAADAHYFIKKVERGPRTVTTIERLDEAERAGELARMLGAGPEGIPLEHARELLNSGRNLRDAARTG